MDDYYPRRGNEVHLAVSQSYTRSSLAKTLSALRKTAEDAARYSVDILLFPEAYLGGYPRTCSFGAAVGSRTPEGRDQFLAYFQSCVDLGDTPTGAGEDWLKRRLPAGADGRRGDGTREYLEDVARETGVFIITGVVEKAGGSLFCAAVYVDPIRGVIGKRRKLMPTGSERLIWSQGTADTLKAVTTTIRGIKITMAAAICWENMMPLLRYSLYAQNVNLWLAPTADPRETWEPLMKTVAMEGRCFVMSANQCQKESQLPYWITGRRSRRSDSTSPYPTRGDERNRDRSRDRTGDGDRDKDRDRSRDRRRRKVLGSTVERPFFRTDEDDTDAPGPPLPHHPSTGPGGEPPNGATHDREMDENDHTNNSKDPGIILRPRSRSSSASRAPSPARYKDPFVSCGGSCIIGPMGNTLRGPVWEGDADALITTFVDFSDCTRGKLDFDAAGHYARHDQFQLSVAGLSLNPPP